MKRSANEKKGDTSTESIVTDRDPKLQKIEISEKTSKLLIDTDTPEFRQLDDTMNDAVQDIAIDADEPKRIPAFKISISKGYQEKFKNPILTKKELMKCKPSIDIKNIKFISIHDNKIIIATDDKNTYDQLNEPWSADAFERGVKILSNHPSKKLDLVIKGVHKELDINQNEVVQELLDQGITNPTRITRKMDQTATTIIRASATNLESFNAAISNKVIISLVKHSCEPAKTITQCYNCQQVGHTHFECKNKTACTKCGGDHRFKDCKSTKIFCVNCKREHFALARTCQYLKAATNEVNTKLVNNNYNKGSYLARCRKCSL